MMNFTFNNYRFLLVKHFVVAWMKKRTIKDLFFKKPVSLIKQEYKVDQ